MLQMHKWNFICPHRTPPSHEYEALLKKDVVRGVGGVRPRAVPLRILLLVRRRAYRTRREPGLVCSGTAQEPRPFGAFRRRDVLRRAEGQDLQWRSRWVAGRRRWWTGWVRHWDRTRQRSGAGRW